MFDDDLKRRTYDRMTEDVVDRAHTRRCPTCLRVHVGAYTHCSSACARAEPPRQKHSLAYGRIKGLS
jgi:hypothetical protein